MRSEKEIQIEIEKRENKLKDLKQGDILTFGTSVREKCEQEISIFKWILGKNDTCN